MYYKGLDTDYMDVGIEYFCSNCDEYKESENIEFHDYSFSHEFGTHSEFYSTCFDCGNEIEITETY